MVLTSHESQHNIQCLTVFQFDAMHLTLLGWRAGLRGATCKSQSATYLAVECIHNSSKSPESTSRLTCLYLRMWTSPGSIEMTSSMLQNREERWANLWWKDDNGERKTLTQDQVERPPAGVLLCKARMSPSQAHQLHAHEWNPMSHRWGERWPERSYCVRNVGC